MAVIGTAFVQVRPDTATFEKEASHRISGALKRVAVVAGAAFAAAGAKKFLQGSVEGYRQHNKLLDVTARVIKTTGGAAKISAKGVSALSDAIERKTGVDGDAIQSGANLLLTFTNVRNEAGKGNKVFNKATGLLADMSVALGQSAKGSAIQLGKALNDPVKGVTALSKVGVSFDAQQKKAIKTAVAHHDVLAAQKIILKELGKEFGGAAAAQVDAADRQEVAFHTLQDAVGAQLLPILDKFHAVMADKILPALTDLAVREGPKVTAFFSTATRGLQGLFDLLVKGDFTGSKNLFGFAEDSKVVDFLFDAREAVIRFFGSMKGADTSGIKAALGSVVDSLVKLGPVIADAARSLPAFDDTISVGAKVLGFFADHVDLLKKALPFLIAGLVLYKAAQLANNTVGRNSVVGFIAQTVATYVHAASQRSLAAAIRGQTAASIQSNGVGKVSILTRLREATASVASAVASKIAAGATKVWAAGQWLLNAALTANPIGLVVVAIGLLVAGLIIAYKKSETFRSVVQGMAKAVIGYFKLVASFWLIVVQGILTGLSSLFGALGHLPGKLGAPFRAAKSAIDSAKAAVQSLQDKINGAKGKNVKVTVTTPGADAAIRKLADLRWQQDHIDPTVTIRGYVRANKAGNALGTPYWSGGWTKVGEHGQEMVNLPRGSRIYDHNKTRRMEQQASGPAAQRVVQLTGVVSPTVEQLAAAVQRRLREDDVLSPTY